MSIRSVLLFVFISTLIPLAAKVEYLMPYPQHIKINSGFLRIGGNVNLKDPTNTTLLRDFFIDNGCRVSTEGFPVTVTIMDSIAGMFNYELPGYPNEAYSLKVTSDGIAIDAVSKIGVIRAAQTLIQLAEDTGEDKIIEAVDIYDWPAFKVRGYMHDTGRSFIETDELVKQIELLSKFKVNTFHWHLTENQAWRYEVRKCPELTSTRSMTRDAGKYYSRNDCRRIIDAANKHGMIIIPEIDMPGHSAAFIRAMGTDMQSEIGKKILFDVLEDVAEVFAESPYIHIGGDEVAITDSTFLDDMIAKVHSLGKRVICWNKINGVDISKHNFDMTQMWATAGKKVGGLPNIDCRYNYANHFDVFADLVGIFKSSIYYEPQGSSENAGTICCFWNDRKLPDQNEIINQNNFYANVLAVNERAWTGGGKQYIEKGGTQLPLNGDEFDEFANWEKRFLFHKANSLSGHKIPYVKQTNVKWQLTDPFPNCGDSSAVFPPEINLADSYLYNGKTYKTHEAIGAGIYLKHTWGNIIPSLFESPELNSTAYAYTFVYSPIEQDAGALIEFQNYGRSECDLSPDLGCWDRKGSKIWLNDSEIVPPRWGNAGVRINNEINLSNENFASRPPVVVHLKKGWNKVLVKLPYIVAKGVRLNKWMFTFALTDLNGRDALADIIYSPHKQFDEVMLK